MHEHEELNHVHVLLYCKACDVVFCEGCRKEWKREYTTWTYKTTPVWNTCNNHYTIPSDDSGTITVT